MTQQPAARDSANPPDADLRPDPQPSPPAGANLDSGFSATWEGGQLDSPFSAGNVGGADPASVFQQYGGHPYSALPPPSGSSQGGSTPAGGQIPDLIMVLASAPGYLPEPPPSGSGGKPALPAYITTTFDAATFRAAQNAMISATAETVALYKSLRSLVLSTSDWVFGQNAVVYIPAEHQSPGPDSQSKADRGDEPDPFTPASYAPDPALFISPENNPDVFAGTPGHAGMNDAQANTMVLIADGLELVGQFLGMMQRTGIAYASADASSVAPPAETSGG